MRLISTLQGHAYHFCITPVATSAKRMHRSLMDLHINLHIILASSLLPPLPGECLEDSGTCISFLHHPFYHPCQEDAQMLRDLYIICQEFHESCHSVTFYFMRKTPLLQQEVHLTKYDPCYHPCQQYAQKLLGHTTYHFLHHHCYHPCI